MHIEVSTRDYMDIVRDVKTILHKHGIHSGTVQPELRGREGVGPRTRWGKVARGKEERGEMWGGGASLEGS